MGGNTPIRMPELPEVETIRRHLAPHVEGRTIVRAEILDHRWTLPGPIEPVEDGIRGRRIERLGRRGKYLLAELDDGATLVIHLRMTGTLLYDPPDGTTHIRVRLGLDDGGEVAFSDPRRFGTGHLLGDPAATAAYLDARLGLEPLDPEFTPEHLRAQARGRRAPVKAFLLDQRRIAGVGNIYADEALFAARIHPLRPTGSLTRLQIGELRDAVVAALEAGIAAKGATIDDFRDPSGAYGTFQDRFQVHLREGEPCPRCGTAIVKLRAAGRGTYVCPSCQRAPRPRRVVRRTTVR
jgi:formamidopyrimidine-DNA glycosylase